jgi:integrase
MTIAELIANFEAWAGNNLRPATLKIYSRYLRKFASACGSIEAHAARPVHLLSWAKTWHHFQAVQRLFNWAVEVAEIVERNPFKKLKRPKLGERHRVLSPRQVAKILRRTNGEFRWFLMAMRETIARPQEVRQFRWEFIEWDADSESLEKALHDGSASIVLEDFKAKDRRADPRGRRVIPISRRLGRLLLRLMSRRTNLEGPIFLNRYGKAWTSNAVRCRMRRLRLKTGLPLVDHRGEKIVAYTMRHSMATVAASIGIRDKVLSESMGHTNTRTTARYQHLDVDHLRNAIEKLSQYRRRKSAS